jgi:hypothetical protein
MYFCVSELGAMIELFNLRVALDICIKYRSICERGVGNLAAPMCIAGQPTRNREWDHVATVIA